MENLIACLYKKKQKVVKDDYKILSLHKQENNGTGMSRSRGGFDFDLLHFG